MLGRVVGPLERAAFRPGILSAGLVSSVAIVPAVIAGLLIFQGAAAEMLLIALVIGGVVHAAARFWALPIGISPVAPALIGVGMIGPAADLYWAVVVASGAALLEVGRARFLPAARNEIGLLVYGAAFLLAGGSVARYFNPSSTRHLDEPIRLWLSFFPPGGAPLDPIRLYVGNVPGPVFATSLLGVAVGAAWLWYARRLSLVVILGFLVGALGVIALMGWNVGFQLESGPTWFVVALVLADRGRLPAMRGPRPLLGIAAGVITMALRSRGVGIEGAILTVAALQATVSLVEGAGWLVYNRARLLERLQAASSRGASQLRLVMARRRAV